MMLRAALLMLALFADGAADADGGTVRIQQDAGPFRITVFSAPEPLRAGSADVSVLVQRRDSAAAVLDADVAIRLDGPPPAMPNAVRATRAAATNQLLYAARVELAEPGVWKLRVTVRAASETVEVATPLPVVPRSSRLRELWPYLALPPLAVGLFALHEWRTRRRAPSLR